LPNIPTTRRSSSFFLGAWSRWIAGSSPCSADPDRQRRPASWRLEFAAARFHRQSGFLRAGNGGRGSRRGITVIVAHDLPLAVVNRCGLDGIVRNHRRTAENNMTIWITFAMALVTYLLRAAFLLCAGWRPCLLRRALRYVPPGVDRIWPGSVVTMNDCWPRCAIEVAWRCARPSLPSSRPSGPALFSAF